VIEDDGRCIPQASPSLLTGVPAARTVRAFGAGREEVVMTRQSLAGALFALGTAVVLTACGGGTAGVDPAAAEAARGETPVATDDQSSTDGTAEEGSAQSGSGNEDPSDVGARPGAPEPEANGARPGGPFDIEAFENIGAPFSGLRETAAFYCAGGTCHLAEPPDVIDGDPDDLDGGVGECRVASISYDPASEVRDDGEFFQKGAEVIAHVDCDPTNDSDAGSTTEGGATPEVSTTPEESATPEDSTTPAESTTAEESTSTSDGATSEEPPA
jgi:hypothetical protein